MRSNREHLPALLLTSWQESVGPNGDRSGRQDFGPITTTGRGMVARRLLEACLAGPILVRSTAYLAAKEP